MNKKWLLLCLLIMVTAICFAGCRGKDAYRENDKLGYNVSVKFDANGGSFVSGNTPHIVDSFNVSTMEKNAEGKVEIALLAPENRKNILMTKKNSDGTDMYLIGWYKQRIQAADGSYTYAEPWNFDTDRVFVDPNGDYSSSEPVMTLYAAWAPQFTVEFCNMDSAEKETLGVSQIPPSVTIKMPAWNNETGALDMGEFPSRTDYTYQAAYYDAEGKMPIEGENLIHTGVINRENGTVENPYMKVYITWKQGNWFRISTAQQFKDNFSLSGKYDIVNDLDFSDVIWPTSCMHGDFTGVIQGNGYTFRNISIEQTNTNKMNTGLFGNLTASASIWDLTFENVTLTISKGSRLSGVNFGLLAGNLAAQNVAQDVRFVGCRIVVAQEAYLQPDSYSIGLICGMGVAGLDSTGISFESLNPDVNITVTEAAPPAEEVPEENM